MNFGFYINKKVSLSFICNKYETKEYPAKLSMKFCWASSNSYPNTSSYISSRLVKFFFSLKSFFKPSIDNVFGTNSRD